MQVAYFVHDLSDSAVARRIGMLRAAGAQVRLLGFRRTAGAPATVAGLEPYDLGRTHDARLAARAVAVAANLVKLPSFRRFVDGADVILARNLETLVLAAAARALHAPRARLAYECLDIHGAMLSPGLRGRLLRRLEGALLDRCDSLLVSSPGFVREYFEPFQGARSRPRLQSVLVENKVFGPQPARPPRPPPGPPWRIGWFGMVRCRRSLDALHDLARRRPDLVEVIIRGRPSYTEFDDFEGQCASLPNLRFLGPYAPQDLPALYGETHFNWSIDYFQDEGNSRWLLPNRLYEGGLYGAPPIARRGSEAAAWLADQGLGLVFDRPEVELEAFLDRLAPEAYATLAAIHAAAPAQRFLAGPEDCQVLAEALRGARAPIEPLARPERLARAAVAPVAPAADLH